MDNRPPTCYFGDCLVRESRTHPTHAVRALEARPTDEEPQRREEAAPTEEGEARAYNVRVTALRVPLLEPQRYVQEELHPLADVGESMLVLLLAGFRGFGVGVGLVLDQGLAGERGPERRARPELRRAPPLAVARAHRRRRCRRAHRAACTQQDCPHFSIRGRLHLPTNNINSGEGSNPAKFGEYC
ncbi:hypothetical protein EVAR_40273_1 [Eumeta japonica]|uniref:Uncharacterized protein n=1 Tax=Eumeta variegata TaxID=151549 RepID=A0A4C1WX78_EUMVA|nr:hypothetical protein EVAR_40273_1 [Eumeta japonica]